MFDTQRLGVYIVYINNAKGNDEMATYKTKAEKFESLGAEYTRHAEKAYAHGDFELANTWVKASETAYANYNYYWGLYLATPPKTLGPK
jgi:hypothetical protein